jgi:phage virion morphogenesis protein|nr:MAG TPA: virion morphogenesis protein [Caudoviricetes sp.]DAY21048.1 MAG TPA: virion morphogenesis protein [Caudoviricetes sp.]
MQLVVSDQLPQLAANLLALEDKLGGDLTPLMDKIGALLENSTRERFESKRDPDGISWEQLKPATIARKQHKNGSIRGGILVDHGDLRKSITYHASVQSVAVGTDRHYGQYHQTGTVHLPARRFLGLSTEDQNGINDIIHQFLEDVL